jgi:hypothetical protein
MEADHLCPRKSTSLIYLPTSAKLCSNSSGAASILRAKSRAHAFCCWRAEGLTDEQVVALLKTAFATVERTPSVLLKQDSVAQRAATTRASP